MLRLTYTLSVAVMTAAIFMGNTCEAQQTFVQPQEQQIRVNPNPGSQCRPHPDRFYDHQLGVHFTRINTGHSRPHTLVNPGAGGGGGLVMKGLRIDSVNFHGLGKRLGLEVGDVIVACNVRTLYQTNVVGGGNLPVSTDLQVIDIRTGRIVLVNAPHARITLDIHGTGINPGVGGGNPGGGNPGGGESRPSYRTFGR